MFQLTFEQALCSISLRKNVNVKGLALLMTVETGSCLDAFLPVSCQSEVITSGCIFISPADVFPVRSDKIRHGARRTDWRLRRSLHQSAEGEELRAAFLSRFHWFLLNLLGFGRWNSTAGFEDHRYRSSWRLRPKQGPNREEETPKHPEERRCLLQHSRSDEDWWRELTSSLLLIQPVRAFYSLSAHISLL